MNECDCGLDLDTCDSDDPHCRQYADDLPDDDPVYDPPPMRCEGPLKWHCFDTACYRYGCVEAPEVYEPPPF